MSSAQSRRRGRTAGQRASGKGQGKPSARILVVDDDPDFVLVTRLALERHGYQVFTATEVDDAKRKVEEERPDLIILDVMMPTGTEGFHFVWDLRNHADLTLRNTPVVVLSAIHRTTDLRLYPDESDREYRPGEFLPVQAFLDKPVDQHELAHVVEAVLAGRPSA